jgi:LPS O-antigen subunit length determinant protein (WzzB/FepE family)
MTTEQADKRLSFMQYLNTGLLTLILAVAGYAATVLIDVKKTEADTTIRVVKLETVQANNVNNVNSLSVRVFTLETNYIEDLRAWVENNYVRKPQK